MIHPLVLYIFLIILFSMTGGVLPLLFRKHQKEEKILKLFVSFGAGLLLGMATLHMLPEASRELPESYSIWFLIGFVLLLILEKFVMVHACEEHACDYHTIGIAAFAGMGVHNFIEGMALGSSLFIPKLAPMVLLAILSHKVPAMFSLTSILALDTSRSPKNILLFLVGVSLTAPLGMCLTFSALQSSNYIHHISGFLLAISAGTFLYIATCDLIPELHRESTDRIPRLFSFLVGLSVCYLSLFLLEAHH